MSMKKTIIEAMDDPRLFGPLFKKPETWSSWRVFLKAAFGLAMDGPELEFFRRFTGRETAPVGQVKEVYAIVGRNGGKSYTGALIGCYLALFHDWRPYLAKGERAVVMCIAADRRQAEVIFNYVRGILGLKMFKGLVERSLTSDIFLTNMIQLSVKTCDYRTLRGFSAAVALCDEAAFWRVEGRNPSGEVIRALRPGLERIPGSMLIITSTPYSKTGPLYQAFKTKYGKDDPDVLVWRATSKEMNPTIREETVQRAFDEDPVAARAEWLAEFREDIETYLESERIEACVVPDRGELPYVEGLVYRAFADPSGGKRDSFALGVGHQGALGAVILDRLVEIRPSFKPLDAVARCVEVLREYRIGSVTSDRFGGEWVSSAFKDLNIEFETSARTKSEIYLAFEPLVNQQQVELLDSRRMIGQLRGLERRTHSGGRDSVDHSAGELDDLANVTAGVCCLIAGERDTREGRVMAISGRAVRSSIEEKAPEDPGGGRVFISSSGRSGRDLDLESDFRRVIHDQADKAKAVRDKKPIEDKD